MANIRDDKSELDLYYNTVVSAIRAKQVNYLCSVKSQPFVQELPEIEELSPEEYSHLTYRERLSYDWSLFWQRRAYRKALRRQKRPVDEDLTKGYNAGIEMALSMLEREHATYLRGFEESHK